MADQRPNIILIITDQQRFDTIRSLGFPYMDTPHLDRLVQEGVSFDNCFITAPLCSPSRASLFSGYYPHTTGIHRNADLWRRSWVEQLNEAGYYCVNIGKMHTFPYETTLGFHERYVALRLTLILFVLLFISLLALIMQGSVLRWLGVTNTTIITLIHNLRWIVIILLFFFAIAIIYRYAPSVQKRWKFISPGSIVATFLMILFTGGFSYYVSNFSNYNELYGSISTVLVLMLLIYFNSLVLLIGFELNVSINSLKHEVDERNRNLAGGIHSA